mmetsp:Transcript_9214/g.20445  ORF Transcript_9214/g.20445 Transcript_9214/m.20445 type:complete len:233 (-) Transcript_9214:86-784(-)
MRRGAWLLLASAGPELLVTGQGGVGTPELAGDLLDPCLNMTIQSILSGRPSPCGATFSYSEILAGNYAAMLNSTEAAELAKGPFAEKMQQAAIEARASEAAQETIKAILGGAYPHLLPENASSDIMTKAFPDAQGSGSSALMPCESSTSAPSSATSAVPAVTETADGEAPVAQPCLDAAALGIDVAALDLPPGVLPLSLTSMGSRVGGFRQPSRRRLELRRHRKLRGAFEPA